jgi:HAMP domain-containing protein
MPMSSVRNRLFVLIAGTALLASLSIGVAYLATESEHVAAREDARTVANLYSLTILVSDAIFAQESAVDDYLLTAAPDAVGRYTYAVDTQLRLGEEIKAEAKDHPKIVATLEVLEARAKAWRGSFGAPAIAAVTEGSPEEVARIIETVAADREPTLAGVSDLVDRIADAERAATARDEALTRTRALATVFGIALMLLAAAASLVMARRWVTHPLDRLLTTATEVESGADVTFVTERDDEIGRLGGALERMRCAPAGRGSVWNSQPLHRSDDLRRQRRSGGGCKPRGAQDARATGRRREPCPQPLQGPGRA